MLRVNTWLRWSSLSSRIKFFLSPPLSFCGDEGLKWRRSIWPQALVHSFENGLNNIPPYIEVVSERVRGIPPILQTLTDFHLLGFHRSCDFSSTGKLSNLFQSGGHSSPSLLRTYQYPSYHLQFDESIRSLLP